MHNQINFNIETKTVPYVKDDVTLFSFYTKGLDQSATLKNIS